MMHRTALALATVLALCLPGCVHHHHPPVPSKHPHGMPPGQAKKLYRCGHCGVTGDVALKCHGKVMLVVD